MTRRRLSIELTALAYGLALFLLPSCIYGGNACFALGLADRDPTLDDFEVVAPRTGDAVDGAITLELAFSTSDDSAIDVTVDIDGVPVATWNSDQPPLTFTPAHDSGPLVLDISAALHAGTGNGEYRRVALDWSAPWQASMLHCAGLGCGDLADGMVIDGPVRIWARPAFDLARTARVEYRVDDAVIATRTEPPFWIDIDGSIAPGGVHTLEATVRRDDGEESTTAATTITTADACNHFLGIAEASHIAIDAAGTFFWSHPDHLDGFAIGRKRVNREAEPLWLDGIESDVVALALVGTELWVLSQSETRIADTSTASPTPTLVGAAYPLTHAAVDDGGGGAIIDLGGNLFHLGGAGTTSPITATPPGTGTALVDYLRDADGSILVGHDQQLTRLTLDGAGVEASRTTVHFVGTPFEEIGRDAAGNYYTAGGSAGLTRWSSDFATSEALTQAAVAELIFNHAPGCGDAIVLSSNSQLLTFPAAGGGLP